MADKLASLQHDISTPNLLFDILSTTTSNILLFYVDSGAVDNAAARLSLTVPAFPGTMNIHQLLCTSYGHIKNRSVSCFCAADKVSCACYVAKDFFSGESGTPEKPVEIVSSAHNQNELNKMNKSVAPDVWIPITHLDSTLVGKFCIIKYDGKLCPGKILQVEADDDDAFILCMNKIGDNRFFWPIYQNRHIQQDLRVT